MSTSEPLGLSIWYSFRLLQKTFCILNILTSCHHCKIIFKFLICPNPIWTSIHYCIIMNTGQIVDNVVVSVHFNGLSCESKQPTNQVESAFQAAAAKQHLATLEELECLGFECLGFGCLCSWVYYITVCRVV